MNVMTMSSIFYCVPRSITPRLNQDFDGVKRYGKEGTFSLKYKIK